MNPAKATIVQRYHSSINCNEGKNRVKRLHRRPRALHFRSRDTNRPPRLSHLDIDADDARRVDDGADVENAVHETVGRQRARVAHDGVDAEEVDSGVVEGEGVPQRELRDREPRVLPHRPAGRRAGTASVMWGTHTFAHTRTHARTHTLQTCTHIHAYKHRSTFFLALSTRTRLPNLFLSLSLSLSLSVSLSHAHTHTHTRLFSSHSHAR